MSQKIDQLSREALSALNDAALLVAREVDLSLVLQRIVEVARDLIGSRYAALGVADGDGNMVTFIHSGMADEVVNMMPHMPRGKGLLGAIVKEQETIRIANIADDARSSGFPQAHPPMSSMLGVPLIAEGEPVGNLYLTNKVDSAEFTDQDQLVAEMLGVHAALAIMRARRYQAADRRNQQLVALNKASQAIVQDLTLDKVLQQIVDAARELVGAQYAALGLPNQHDMLDEFIHSGMPNAFVEQIGHLPEGHGLLGAIIQGRRAIRLPRIQDDVRSVGFPQGHPPMDSFLGVPVVAGDEVMGNLYFTNKLDGGDFSAEDQEIVEMLAIHAAVAIQNARLYEQVEQLAVGEERKRIGMDLHDGVIQSIFAVGLTLEAAKLTLTEEDEALDLVNHSVDGLNAAIQDIRNFIMDLRPLRFQGNLEQGVGQLLREFQANTMIPVKAEVDVRISSLSPSLARSIFLTIQEALANVARHSKASAVTLSLIESDELIELIIRDNGIGIDLSDTTRRVGHGLHNMRKRAEDADGRFSIETAPNNGLTIKLEIPLLKAVLSS